MPDVGRRKFTPPQVAEMWGVSPEKVITWIRNGELRAINAATRPDSRPRYLIDVEDLAAFEQKRCVPAPIEAPRRRRRAADDLIEFF